MKFLKSTLLVITLFATGYECAAKVITQRATATSRQRATARPATQKSAKGKIQTILKPTSQQEPIAEIKSYGQALNAIRTSMPSDTILKNNALTLEFINFVKALNLSDIENKALLEAGINLHARWTGDETKDKTLFLTLKNNIESIMQKLKSGAQSQPILPHTPVKTPASPSAKEQQIIAPAKLYTQTLPAPIEAHCATNSAMIILDPNENETIESSSRAMVYDALNALQQQAAPIIMTSNILEVITHLRQQIGNDNLQKLRTTIQTTTDTTALESFAKELLRKNNSKESVSNLIRLSLINFDNKNLNCYFHNSANLVLIIPRQYLQINLPNFANLSLNDQAQACGFNPIVMTAINDLTADNLMKKLQIQKSTSIDEEQFTIELTSLFLPQKEEIKWAIYLTGHGGPARKLIGTIREELEERKKDLAFWKDLLIFWNDTLKQDKNHIEAKERIASIPPIISKRQSDVNEYEKILQNKSDWPNSKIIPESARVAGLNLSNFAYLLKFFNKNIKVAFLHYATCFSGGYNQAFVNEILSSLNVNFIVSSEGLDERGTAGISPQLIPNNTGTHLIFDKQPFADFFRQLQLFIGQPEEFVKTKGEKKEPVAQILRTIVLDMKKENQPFVRFPGAGVFEALSLGKSTKNLTQSIVKSHEIENKPINVSDTNIGIVVVNPSRINVPLNLGNNADCAIVSPSPKNPTPSYEAIHVFKEVNFENTIQSLLFNLIHLNIRLYTQTFVVKTLTGILYEQSNLPIQPNKETVINNLIIQMKGINGTSKSKNQRSAEDLFLMAPINNFYGKIDNNLSTIEQEFLQFTPLIADDIEIGEIGINVNVSFELNNNIYQCTLGVKNFKQYFLQSTIKKTIFISQSATTMDMSSVASKFLSPQEAGKLARPITLDSIIQCIDSKIDQQGASIFQQPDTNNEALGQFLKRKQK